MKPWMTAVSAASALFLAFACADDDPPLTDATGGSGGEAGGGADSGGSVNTGGAITTGGRSAAGGGAGGQAGESVGGAGAGGAPITCEPPEPPTSGDGAGGAAGAGGNAGAAGESAGGAGGAADVGGAGGVGGANGGASGVSSSQLAIEGSYVDTFMGHHVITASSWTSGPDTAGAVFHIAAYSNSAHWIVARNDQANEYNPCLWSRFDWTEQGGVLYYCQSAFAAESEATARATPAPDASDPTTKGCGGGFPWTALTPE